jgi:hypothetical protein
MRRPLRCRERLYPVPGTNSTRGSIGLVPPGPRGGARAGSGSWGFCWATTLGRGQGGGVCGKWHGGGVLGGAGLVWSVCWKGRCTRGAARRGTPRCGPGGCGGAGGGGQGGHAAGPRHGCRARGQDARSEGHGGPERTDRAPAARYSGIAARARETTPRMDAGYRAGRSEWPLRPERESPERPGSAWAVIAATASGFFQHLHY